VLVISQINKEAAVGVNKEAAVGAVSTCSAGRPGLVTAKVNTGTRLRPLANYTVKIAAHGLYLF
jgi:hypothetical protein